MSLPNHLGRFLWHFVKKQRVSFALIVLTSWVWSINEAVFPFFMKLIINTVSSFTEDRSLIFSALVWPLTGITVLWLIMEVAMRVQGILMVYVFPKFRANIRNAVFEYIQGHSHNFFADELAGRIGSKMSDLPSSAQHLVEIIIFNFISIGTGLIIGMLMMLSASPLFALITFTWMSLHLGITFLFLVAGNKKAAVHSDSISTLTGKIIDAVTNMLNVRLFSHSRFESRYLGEYQEEEMKKSRASGWHLEKMKIILGALGTTFIITLIYTLVYSWSQDHITIGDFTLVMMLSFNMLGLIWFLSFQATVFIRETGTISAALSLVSKDHDVTDKPGASTLETTSGLIEFNNVGFGYKTESEVFSGLNVTIKPGEKIGLVGFSGAGKSTFVNLLLRFYDIKSGAITIDGKNIQDVTQHSLRRAISMIPQDPSLFHRSLKDNIRYGRLDATDEEIVTASKLAHCDEFIAHLDEGYDTLVGERGIKLSGGQRQRIAIARAILKAAPILVLDEATSALDSVTEKLIQESLADLMVDRTTLVVAHRLSTLANMDRILVFENGVIIEDGSMQSLLSAEGHFAMLWKNQQDGLLPG